MAYYHQHLLASAHRGFSFLCILQRASFTKTMTFDLSGNVCGVLHLSLFDMQAASLVEPVTSADDKARKLWMVYGRGTAVDHLRKPLSSWKFAVNEVAGIIAIKTPMLLADRSDLKFLAEEMARLTCFC